MIIIPMDPESPHIPGRTMPVDGTVTDRWGRLSAIARTAAFPLAARCSACTTFAGQIVLAAWDATWQHAAFTPDQPGYPRRTA